MNPSLRDIRIACFSGTGGARRAAEALLREFTAQGATASLLMLEGPARRGGWGTEAKPDLLVLVFAVHAFDAPEPVYRWLKGTDLVGVRGAVLSVSGGGEMWPNTGCRRAVIAMLQSRGCDVFYDRMLIMPCNWVIGTGDHVAMHLLLVLPDKARAIAGDILSGRECQGQGRMGAIRRRISAMEKAGVHQISGKYRLEGCTGCGWCERSCPVGSITMASGKPVFGDRCVACFRCVYGCPAHAIKSKNFMIVQKGFSIDELERRMEGVELKPVEQCCKGWAWKGVREYLLNPDE